MRLSIQDAAQLLGVSEKTIYRWIKKGALPACRVSDQYRFNRSELLAWGLSRRKNVSEEHFHETLQVAGPIPTMLEAVQRGGIVYRLEGGCKEGVLRNLAQAARFPVETDRHYLSNLLLAREGLGPTGVGDGYAIPQLIYPNALEPQLPVIVIAFVDQPVEYDSMDGLPVFCLFGLLSSSLRGYYFLLNRLYYALRDEAFRTVLRSQGSREELFAHLHRIESGLRANPPP
ncbi:helix-turn-helix domain-containing protein [bacterium]|nr:helix-turn-helix domain-containing protein [bacterium]